MQLLSKCQQAWERPNEQIPVGTQRCFNVHLTLCGYYERIRRTFYDVLYQQDLYFRLCFERSSIEVMIDKHHLSLLVCAEKPLPFLVLQI